MKDVLLKLKEAYLDYVSGYKVENGYSLSKGVVGLCFTSYRFLSVDDDELFQKYLSKYKETHKVFYDSTGDKVEDKTQFLWNPRDIQVRIDWLDKQIKKVS